MTLLAQDKFAAQANEFVRELEGGAPVRSRVLIGDICDMDLGLAGREYKDLAAAVTHVYHFAAIYFLGVKREEIFAVNVDGTRGILALCAEAPKLERLAHLSSVYVHGTKTGVIMEEDLDPDPRFRNPYEESKHRAEIEVRRASARIPTSIFRVPIIVGHSKTGEIDRFPGPYYLMIFLVAAPFGFDLPLGLGGFGSSPLNVVPVDWIVDAIAQITQDPRGAGRTFHLTDPNPLPAKRIFDLVAAEAKKSGARNLLTPALARGILKMPGLDSLARIPRQALDLFSGNTIYNCRNTLELLQETKVRCPAFDGYAPQLVRYVQSFLAKKHAEQQARAEADPLE